MMRMMRSLSFRHRPASALRMMSSAARVTGAGAGTGATDAGAVDGEGEGVTMFYNDVYKVQLPPKHKFPMDKYQVRVE